MTGLWLTDCLAIEASSRKYAPRLTAISKALAFIDKGELARMRTEIDPNDEVVKRAVQMYTMKRSAWVGIDAQATRAQNERVRTLVEMGHDPPLMTSEASTSLGPLGPVLASTTGSRAAFPYTLYTALTAAAAAPTLATPTGLDPNLLS